MASANRKVVFQQIDRLYQEGTLLGMADGQLLDRYLALRDEAAFEALVRLHGPMVLGLCRRMLRDPRDIEDAFQATFLILVRKAPTIRDRGLLSNWLYGVAYRVARRARTNTLRRRDREVAVAHIEAPAAPAAADTLQIGPELDQELNRLPPKYRVPLILCYLEGHTHNQAAAELDCPVGTVRSRLARGRDLLRRRLTIRGHAPTMAILGQATALPAKLMCEPVPPSLVTATVDAALGIGASKTIQAGVASASALALTQGVLTTMKVAQLKVFGLAILATGLSVGGVVAVSYAAGQSPKNVQSTDPFAVTAANTQEQSNTRPAIETPVTVSPSVDKRLRDLEAQLDAIQRRSTGTATVSTPIDRDPFKAVADPTKPNDDAAKPVDSSSPSIRKLQIELDLAIEDAIRNEKLYERKSISTSERDRSRGKVLIIKAMLQGLDDELVDDLDRIELEIKKKKAELDQAMAQKEMASIVVVNTMQLKKQKGVVSEVEVATHEWKLRAADAQCAVKKVEIEEVELRKEQMQRRLGRIKQIMKAADRLKEDPSSASAR